jgi:hypothetical protein
VIVDFVNAHTAPVREPKCFEQTCGDAECADWDVPSKVETSWWFTLSSDLDTNLPKWHCHPLFI